MKDFEKQVRRQQRQVDRAWAARRNQRAAMKARRQKVTSGAIGGCAVVVMGMAAGLSGLAAAVLAVKGLV